MSHDPKPLGGKIISKPVMIFGPLIVICMLLIVKRLVFGLGSVSDLNGGFPWGVWIAFDLLIGTGFACGGWALAWAVYVFNRGQYHPLVRPALLASLFGYSLGGLSITIDVGRYWNLPYFYIPGHFNVNSVLFETAVCMTIYIGVMALEFAPALFERLGWEGVATASEQGDVLHHRARCVAADHAPVFNGVADDLGGLQGASAVAEL